jgi:hypothetical protein
MPEMFKMLDASGYETEPFDRGALITYARQGIVQPTTPILEITTGSWKPASELIRLWSDSHAPQPSRSQLGANSGLSGRTLALAIIGGAALAIAGGFLVLKFRARPTPAPQQTSTNQPQTVMTADRRYAVIVPSNWVQRKTKRPGGVEYTSGHRHSGFGMAQVSQAVLTPTDFATYVDGTIRESSNATGMNPIGAPKPITVNGFSGLQQDVRKGSLVDNTKIRTSVLQTPYGIYSIMTFVDSNSNFSLDELDTIPKSFRPMATGAAAPSPQ